ncbi:MAG TPA: aldo/keto reductase [Halobacteriales archaeon]|nr:aldo/keto reductase [Halobacteriales archaeon]
MEVAFAGAGDVAGQYASGLPDVDGLTLAAVADPDRDRAAAFAADAGCDAYADVPTMLCEADPDLVVNLTSHAAHAPVTRTCLETGVHVWSEKPLALDPTGATELVELAESSGLGLGCAPISYRCEQQRLAARRLADGTLGDVSVAHASAHVGRVTEWHDRPKSFLEVGPLLDGAVYPLALLVEWFGPVARVRTADASAPYPAREGIDPDGLQDRDAPTHVEATLALRDGPLVRLSASFYVPHTAREFYGVELHGDDASLYLEDAGDLGGDRDHLVAVGRAGREYTPVPLQHPPRETPLATGPAALAAAVRRGESATTSARRAAHLVAVCDAIERAAASREPVAVDDCGFEPGGLPEVCVGPGERHGVEPADRRGERTRPVPNGSGGQRAAGPRRAIRLPPVGFGCSRYRGGEYVDRADSIEAALDAGYRLLDSAELYGNEARIGDILAAPGSPDREALFVASKVWNTNHGSVREACETTLDALGIDALDCYMLHWPESWQYTGPLADLASLPVEEQEARTFPRDEDGEPIPGDATLEDAWRGLEALNDAGLARTIGVCNVDRETLSDVLDFAEVLPAVVQVERHPYQPRDRLVEYCHERGIRVVAHSPLSAPGLLDELAIAEIADAHDATPAQVVLAWNVASGVVPIPSSVDRDHVVENAAAAGLRLTDDERARIDGLADADFQR